MEAARSSTIVDIIHSGEALGVRAEVKAVMPVLGTCTRCGFVASNELCKACVLLQGLNAGKPKCGSPPRAPWWRRLLTQQGPAARDQAGHLPDKPRPQAGGCGVSWQPLAGG